MGSSGITSLINLFITNIDVLAWPVVSLVYPLYASIREIEMKTGDDVQQWLTYWVLYSMITLFEDTFVTLVEWLTLWPYAKLMLSCWLVYFNGAAYVYQHYIRPCVVIIPPPPPPPEPVQVSKLPRRKRGSSKRDNMLAYFTQRGLEKMMHKDKPRKAPR